MAIGGFEVEPARSGGFPHIHPNHPPVPRETDLPSSAAQAAVSISPDRSAAHHMRLPEVSDPLPPSASEASVTQDLSLSGTAQTPPPEVSGAQSVSEPLLRSSSEGTANQDASLSGTAQTPPPEVSGAQSVSEPLLPSGSGGTATQDASLSGTALTRPPEVIGTRPVPEPLLPRASEESAAQGASLIGIVPTLPIPATQRDLVFRDFVIHHDHKVNFGASYEKMPTRNIQQGQSHDSSSTSAVFWSYRVRKECGPIQDSVLHADCVRSFKAQYPVRYASPTRTH
jgi:hypothetical protein